MLTATTEPATGKLMPLSVASAVFGLDVDTPPSWATRGLRTADGERVKLAAAKIGGRWFVEPDALAVFLSRVNPSCQQQTVAALLARLLAAHTAGERSAA
jgi:hypothetical protein